MCRMQCVLALVALSVGLAHSWDIAIGVEDQLIFYTNGTKTNTVTYYGQNFTALAYDEIHDMMLYVNKQSKYDSICGYNLYSRENKCFIKRNGSTIQGIAYDPPTQTLYFTDANDNSINRISLKPGSINNVTVERVIKIDDGTLGDITLDSCGGYIYWVNKKEKYKNIIERARFNGGVREIFQALTEGYNILRLVFDPLTRSIYYTSHYIRPNDTYHVLKQDVFSKTLKRTTNLIQYNGPFYLAKTLTISKNYVYWVARNASANTVWQSPKDARLNVEVKYVTMPVFRGYAWGFGPSNVFTIFTESPIAIASNYKIEDQIQGLQGCEALSSLIPIVSVANNSVNIEQTTGTEPTTECTTEVDLLCVHGVHVRESSVCECTPGYIGEGCDVSACVNYCLQGNCSLTEDGLPTCRCNAGYSGQRCEVYVCHGYCLNDGDCFLNMKEEPVCQCTGNHEGSRCEIVKNVSSTINNTSTFYSAERNLTLIGLLSKWQKPSAKITITVIEV